MGEIRSSEARGLNAEECQILGLPNETGAEQIKKRLRGVENQYD